MSLNATPRGDRIHIALFGKRNAGKSSVINAMTNQELAIVSDVKGTTTDPVYKAMELLPLGPVVMIDTPGLDDEGELGEKRVKKAKEVLAKADIALVIMDATAGMTEFEEDMIRLIKDRKIPYLKVYNKMDLSNAQEWKEDKACFVSAKDKKGIWELKEEIGKLVPTDDDTLKIVGDLVCPNDFVILVVPIDSAAPKGRLILPQQQTIRDILDTGATAIVTRDSEFADTLNHLGKAPSLVITDSQVFGKISKLAAGHMDLHSRHSSIDLPQLAEWGAGIGASADLQQRMREANTSQQALAMASAAGVALGDAVCQHALDFARRLRAAFAGRNIQVSAEVQE